MGTSAKELQAGDSIDVTPFALCRDSQRAATTLEATFLLDDVRYQYGFSVNAKHVEEEWLIAYPQRSARRLFQRSTDSDGKTEIKFSSFLKGEKHRLKELTRPNALFLSVAANLNHLQLTSIFEWVRYKLRVITPGFNPGSQPGLTSYTASRCAEDPDFRHWLVGLLQAADLGIQEINARPAKPDDMGIPGTILPAAREAFVEAIERNSIHVVKTVHKVPSTGQEAEFDMDEESAGTRRLFELLGPWHDVLEKGYTLFVDELDASMHPLMVRKLIQSFHDPEINRNDAQLVFTTHDTSLLSPANFRRDQVWFTEKDAEGATRLYSLEDYRPRKDEALEKGYLAGRYGAIPYLAELQF